MNIYVILKKSPKKKFLKYVLNLTAVKLTNTIAHLRTILKVKKTVKVLRLRNFHFILKNYISWPTPFKYYGEKLYPTMNSIVNSDTVSM